jgi:tRNA pseudouridine38-40 synthase
VLFAYDGGPYKGFQPHPALPTVGGVLAAALHRAGVTATPFGASRTDAGVHARAQVASFTSHKALDLQQLRAALAADLPSTVKVLAVREAWTTFHAHWSSTGKTYRYRLSFSGESRAWRLPSDRFPYPALDLARLAEALAVLEGAPDVSALEVEGEHGPSVRRLGRARIHESGPRGTTLEFSAGGFGKYLVRHLVAAAVGYSVGAYDACGLARMLSGADPRPPRAPAEGLCLHRVHYPAETDPFPDLEALVDPSFG